METTENHEMTGADPGVVLTPEAQVYLREAGKWANFLGIVGFVFCGLFLIFALFIGTIISTLSQFSPTYSALPAAMGGVLTVVFLLFDVLYFFFALYLYQFGSKIKKGVLYADSDGIAIGLGKLKSLFKLWGIVTIVVLSLYALQIVIAVIGGVLMGNR